MVPVLGGIRNRRQYNICLVEANESLRRRGRVPHDRFADRLYTSSSRLQAYRAAFFIATFVLQRNHLQHIRKALNADFLLSSHRDALLRLLLTVPSTQGLHDCSVRHSLILQLDTLVILLDVQLILGNFHFTHLWLRLHEFAFALATSLAKRIDRLGVPLVLGLALGALPDVLVVDLVRVLGCDFDASRPKSARTFLRPVSFAVSSVNRHWFGKDRLLTIL